MRWWNTTWNPEVPDGAICISVITDDNRQVPAFVEKASDNRARVKMPDDFANGPFGANITVMTPNWSGKARWTLPAYGQGDVEADTELTLEPSVIPFSRERALSYNTHFMGGILVDSPVYGLMPWYDAALAWCDSATRKAAYKAKHKAKDTHCILHVPSGLPLYNEQNQYYSPDKFPALDWTNNYSQLTKDFDNLLYEILQNGFSFHITMDETYENSIRVIPLVAQRLKDLKLTGGGFSMPGYDGVFYGWDPSQISYWGALARSINPNILLGLEFQPGCLPLGEGAPVPDYSPNGRMKDFDIILAEAFSFNGDAYDGSAGDKTWQIVGRCVNPYNRPRDQPADDDPHPPFVLVDSVRGPRYFVYFETNDPYGWVRIDPNNQVEVINKINYIEAERRYVRDLGVKYTG